ncbi:hypothetical protein F4818DRAFT_444502 [Hypoxylon cercidicola]|nr:hypothetical protein F4818DRAFT_444502 [Hypoxylon cercidicola]
MNWAIVIVLFLFAQSHLVDGLSWRREPNANTDKENLSNLGTTRGGLSQLLSSDSRSPSPYEIALNELRELESEPLCHRTAARLLVNNCELLEGKNDATALTDSGRKIRDFVDSYAASLAICDLERGSFHIPRECANFRESVLSQLPLQNWGNLHVSSAEIDGCLQGLGESDSAWNTWVSYRHKALRFCEAARADNEKDQQILLFQRLAKVMGRFSEDADKGFKRHMDNLDLRARETGGRLDELSPKIDDLKEGLKSIEDFFLGRLIQQVKETTDAIHSGTDNAVNLQRMLEAILASAVENQVEVASAYEQSLQLVNDRAQSAVNTATRAVVAVTQSAAHLQTQVEVSRLRAADLESRQENLEQGMQRLVYFVENLTTSFYDHTRLLHEARNITNEIRDTLDDTVASANYVGNTMFKQSSASSWWPYVWCPAASLVLGSYGLPPSAARNLALLALGEVAGLAFSSFRSLYTEFYMPTMKPPTFTKAWGSFSTKTGTHSNATVSPELI